MHGAWVQVHHGVQRRLHDEPCGVLHTAHNPGAGARGQKSIRNELIELNKLNEEKRIGEKTNEK